MREYSREHSRGCWDIERTEDGSHNNNINNKKYKNNSSNKNNIIQHHLTTTTKVKPIRQPSPYEERKPFPTIQQLAGTDTVSPAAAAAISAATAHLCVCEGSEHSYDSTTGRYRHRKSSSINNNIRSNRTRVCVRYPNWKWPIQGDDEDDIDVEKSAA